MKRHQESQVAPAQPLLATARGKRLQQLTTAFSQLFLTTPPFLCSIACLALRFGAVLCLLKETRDRAGTIQPPFPALPVSSQA